MPVEEEVPQDPFRVLTRQLHGPDLDCLISKTTLLFRLQVDHLTLGRATIWRRHEGVRTGRHICGGQYRLSEVAK